MLHDVRECFRDDEVGGELDRIGEAIGNGALHRHGQRRPSCQRIDRSLEPFVPEKGRVDSSGQLAQFGNRLLDFVLCAYEDGRRGRVSPGTFEAECDGQCHEPLLRAVVEVPLDPPPFCVGGCDDPAARRAHLGELRTHLCRQTLVFEHEPGGCTNRLHECRLVEQRWIVD